jgi:hypothetical protein
VIIYYDPEEPDLFVQDSTSSPRFSVIGHVPMPPARRISFAQMTSPQEDSQRGEVEGIVCKGFKKAI